MSVDIENNLLLNALKIGVAPLFNVNAIFVDRNRARKKFELVISDGILNGKAKHVFFAIDFFGNGKTMFCHYSMDFALAKNYLVSKLSLNRGINFNNLHSIYSAIIESLIQPDNDFEASFDDILTKWIVDSTLNQQKHILHRIEKVSTGFAAGLLHYITYRARSDIREQFRALQHLKGSPAVYKALKKKMKLPDPITQSNASNYLKALELWITSIGYNGLVLIFDEVESIIKLTTNKIRAKAYNNIALFCDQVEQNLFKNTVFFFMLTPDLRDNTEKGIATHMKLQEYISQKWNTYDYITTVKLYDHEVPGLGKEDQLVLAQKIKRIHETANNWDPQRKLNNTFLENFVNYINDPRIFDIGLTVRMFVRQLLDILDTTIQNNHFDAHDYLSNLIAKANRS